MNISFERGCHEGRFQASSATVEEIELESDHGFLVSAPFWQKTVTGNRGLSPKYTKGGASSATVEEIELESDTPGFRSVLAENRNAGLSPHCAPADPLQRPSAAYAVG
jgi:hypothetical protein